MTPLPNLPVRPLLALHQGLRLLLLLLPVLLLLSLVLPLLACLSLDGQRLQLLMGTACHGQGSQAGCTPTCNSQPVK